ncbi:MAG: recombination mediator RecR [Clostridia bacterium]
MDTMDKLIACFRALPGVGFKTAQRYAYYIITADKQFANTFAECLTETKNNIIFCTECGNFTDKPLCDICKSRDNSIICVVKEPKDVVSMEKVKSFTGVYHVLHGTLSPLEGRGPNDIRVKELLARVSKNKVKEIIMATNPDVEGDATAMYISSLLTPIGVKVTRLAQGISMGSDIEFTDEATLTRAMEERRQI